MLPESGLRYPVIMLMKVVFPAPLVPINPTTESASIAALISAAAVTAPKLLFTPRASRMTAMSAGPAPREQRPQALRQENDHEQQRRAQTHLPGMRRQIVGESVDRAEEQRAEERGEHAAGAGEDGDEDELARGRPVGHLGVDVADRGRSERAAHPGERRGDHVLDVD